MDDETLSRAGVTNVEEWAMRLNYDVGRLIGSPLGGVLPAPARDLISELSALVGVLARKVSKLEGGQK